MMTKDEILALESGPELNTLVAVEVMGKEVQGGYVLPITPMGERVRNYSGNWRAAGEVVEKFRRGDLPGRHVACCVEIHIYDAICSQDTEVILYGPTLAKVSAMGREFPEAMCRAALLTTLEAEK